jgi:flagellar hook protein FlgE
MIRALNTGVTGIRQFQTNLDTIGNNLANVNTIGFKAGRVEFADTLNQTLRPGTPDQGTRSGTASVQVGNGVEVASVRNLFTQGAVSQTGVTTDLAISGEGFFIVKNANNEYFASRAGDFRVDATGFLVTDQGLRVQGFSGSPAAADYADADAIGDIRLDKPATLPAGLAATAATAGVQNVSIDGSGNLNMLLSDGSQFVRGKILLQKFTNPSALLKQGANLYTGITVAGPLAGTSATSPFGSSPAGIATATASAKATTNGLGRIESGALELSNVDIAREFSNMITTQRAFQANARVVTTSDSILQEIVQLVR